MPRDIVDAQVHTYEVDKPERPWDAGYRLWVDKGAQTEKGRAHAAVARAVPSDEVIRVMDALEVSGAVLVATSHYGWDNSYCLEAAANHLDRLRVVGRMPHDAPDIADRIAAWARDVRTAGIRVLIMDDAMGARVRSGEYERLFASAERSGVPIFMFPPRQLHEVGPIAARHSELPIVIDHLGLPQPPRMTPDADPFERLPSLLALAQYPNVSVKLTAAPTLSNEEFPYPDLWPHLHQVVAAFGPGRLMWGTDWTRTVGVVSAEQCTRFITETSELGEADKREILAGSIRRLLNWQRRGGSQEPAAADTMGPDLGGERQTLTDRFRRY